jgi:surface polysaccharide O-acyltransferase-like enzyme
LTGLILPVENTVSDDRSLPQSPPPSPPAPRERASREAWIDVFRGFAILAVVLIHLLPRFYRLHTPSSQSWWLLFTVQRTMYFAVPGFILLSAMVNTGSLLRRPAVFSFWRSRLGTVVWPYLVWSGLYMAYQRWYTPRGYPLGRLTGDLRWGTAWPHLYFMVVLIQLLIALPLLVLLLRKTGTRRPWWAVVPLAIALGALAYYGNREYVHLAKPASWLVWYLPVVTLGVWLGGEGEGGRGVLRAVRWPALVGAIVAFVFYLRLAAAAALHQKISTMHYQAAEWAYAAAVTLFLLGFSLLLSQWRATRAVAGAMTFLGRYALPVYLAHPLILALIDRYWPGRLRHGEAFAFVVTIIAAVGIPILLAMVADLLRISPVLFGRATASRSPRARRIETTPRAETAAAG